MKFLEIKDLTKTYTTREKPVVALNNISLEIHQGEIFGLLGVNGAGKTTLSSILATLHPPTSGDVLFNGQSIYANINAYRAVLGFCPQQQNLDMHLTVQENLIFAGRYFLMPKETITNRVHELMEQLELTRYADFAIDELSGGTKQRVLIARALMHNPKIVLLDEPTVGLDPDIRRKLWDQIKHLKAAGITIILTTHYLDEAEVLSDRICILEKGSIVLIESVEALKKRHQMQSLEEIFLKIMKKIQPLSLIMISQRTKNNMRVCAQLIRRSLHVLLPRMPSKLIDSTIIAVTQVLVFGCFFPVLGMPARLIGPTFIGTIILMCFSLGYGLVLPSVFDLEQDRFIDYHLTLPIGKFWLFSAYVINFVIEIALTTLPVFFLSIILLGSNFIRLETTLTGFFISYLLSLTLIALIFITFSLRYSLRWFFDNLWPRRLAPLTLLGSIFFVWRHVYNLSPLLGRLFLLNPCTYITESIRASLIGGTEFIPLKICLPVLIVSIIASGLLLKNSITNHLDPV